MADSKVSLAPAKELTIPKKLIDEIKALPAIPTRNGSAALAPQISKRTRSRSRSRGRGRSAPHVDNLINGLPPSTDSELISVDHRAVSDGSKDIVVPRHPAMAHPVISKAAQPSLNQAHEFIPVAQSSEVIARAGRALVGAGSSTKKQLFNVTVKKKTKNVQNPAQVCLKTSAKGLSTLPSTVSTSKSTQGQSRGKSQGNVPNL